MPCSVQDEVRLHEIAPLAHVLGCVWCMPRVRAGAGICAVGSLARNGEAHASGQACSITVGMHNNTSELVNDVRCCLEVCMTMVIVRHSHADI